MSPVASVIVNVLWLYLLVLIGRLVVDIVRMLARMSAQVRGLEPDADVISAGMSSDLEVAAAYGATHLRIGTAVMGSRPTVGYRQRNGGKQNEGEAQ